MVETLAELPFIGDQVVCLSHDQAARASSKENSRACRAGDAGAETLRILALH